MVQELQVFQKPAQLCGVMWSESFSIANRQLKRRTLEMIQQDLQVVRIDVRMLRRSLEEVFRMLNDVLIQRGARGNQNSESRSLYPAGAPGSLPRGCDCSRISGHHDAIERSDVHAEL